MKMTYNWLVAGMLVAASAAPVMGLQAHSSASVHVQLRMTIRLGVQVTDAMAYRILEEVVGTLEAQLQRPLSADILFSEYKVGDILIEHLGSQGNAETFSVTHADGGHGLSVIEDF